MMELGHYYLLVLFMAVIAVQLMHCDAGGTPTSNVAASLQKYVDPLPRMSSLRAGPAKLTIGMYPIRWKFHRDLPPTPVFAYGTSAATASVPGPVIEAVQGVPASITWENHLPSTHILPWDPTITTAIPKTHQGIPTVVHLHGGIHPPVSDGHPFAWFTANFTEKGPTWTQSTYYYPNVQGAGNLWYHDHALGLTRVNLLAGLIGPYVIRERTPNPSLPSGPEFDRHLMIFDRSFLQDGSLYMNHTGNNPSIHPQWQPEYFGDAIVVNGKAWPYLYVRRGKYRFRIINASNARYLRLSLCKGLQFNVIGSDASYLPSTVTSPTILLSPAETFDVVVDFSPATSQECLLTNDAPYPYPTGNNPDQLTSEVMKFVITTQTPTIDETVGSQILPCNNNFSAADAAVAASALTRYITLYEYQSPAGTPTVLYINGKKLTDSVTETPRVGTTEVWEVINLTGDNHPLHIHLAEFQAIKVQELVNLTAFTACMTIKKDAVACNVTDYATGKLLSIPAYEKTWKNVVKIEPGYQTTVVVKFSLVDCNGDRPYPFDVTAEPGYVYHCHILDHEDNEMIRPFKLVR